MERLKRVILDWVKTSGGDEIGLGLLALGVDGVGACLRLPRSSLPSADGPSTPITSEPDLTFHPPFGKSRIASLRIRGMTLCYVLISETGGEKRELEMEAWRVIGMRGSIDCATLLPTALSIITAKGRGGRVKKGLEDRLKAFRLTHPLPPSTYYASATALALYTGEISGDEEVKRIDVAVYENLPEALRELLETTRTTPVDTIIPTRPSHECPVIFCRGDDAEMRVYDCTLKSGFILFDSILAPATLASVGGERVDEVISLELIHLEKAVGTRMSCAFVESVTSELDRSDYPSTEAMMGAGLDAIAARRAPREDRGRH